MAFKSTDFKGHIADYFVDSWQKPLVMTPILTIEELKEAAVYNEREIAEFFIALNFGLRSSKRIVYFPDTDTFDIHNEIDDSWQEDLTANELATQTLISEAIEKKAFYKY